MTEDATLRRTIYSASTGGELSEMLKMFTDNIRLVTQDGKDAEAYYRIEADGEGVIVVKPLDDPQVGNAVTNSGLL